MIPLTRADRLALLAAVVGIFGIAWAVYALAACAVMPVPFPTTRDTVAYR